MIAPELPELLAEGITHHAGVDGYPLCGGQQRPMDLKAGRMSDVVSGRGPWTCEECLRLVGTT